MHLSASAPTPPCYSLSLCLYPLPFSDRPSLPPTCSTRFPAASSSAAHGYLPRCILRCDPVTVSCAHSQTRTHMRARAHTRTLTHSQTRTHSLSLTHSLTHSLTRSATFERAERARVALSPHPICSPLPLKWDAMIHIWCSMPLSSPTPVPDSSGCHSCIRSLNLALIPNLPQSHPGSQHCRVPTCSADTVDTASRWQRATSETLVPSRSTTRSHDRPCHFHQCAQLTPMPLHR